MALLQQITPNVYRALKSTTHNQQSINEIFEELRDLISDSFAFIHIRSREEVDDKSINGNAVYLDGVHLDFRGADYFIVKRDLSDPNGRSDKRQYIE